ncbi:extracellular solute-binding protein [Salinilacihabitans rarus]|uniref:extracellular solute-binding protein n=1 Tax=Salinilacihabitans rarus TaxID=2961596 RepID=UPI0020C8F7BF|nr:extracellular solute-binding protein [Salinilacihabitans rarus]
MSDKLTNVSRGRRNVSRRRFVQAASAAGIVGVAGCTGDEGDDDQLVDDPDAEFEFDEEVTVELYADSDMKELQDLINDALHEGGLHENVSIEVTAGPDNTDERRDFIANAFEAERSSPDLMLTDSGWTIPFIARDQVLNLEQNLSSDVLDHVHEDYFDMVVSTASDIDGNLHALPLFPDFPTMQYRKDLVEETGYDPEGENWATESLSWEEFSHMVEDVKDDHGLEYGFTFQSAAYEGLACCNFNEWLTSFGGAFFGDHDNLFGPIGDRPITINEEPVHDSLRMIRTFVHGHDDGEALDDFAGGISPEAVLQWDEEDSRGPFTDGDAVAHRNWPYSIAINGAEPEEEDDPGFGEDLGVMPIPYGVTADEAEYEGAGGPVAALGGWHITPNPNTEHIEATLAVIEAFTSEPVKLTLWEEQGWVPPEPELFGSDELRDIEPVGRYLDALAVAGENAVARPVTEIWPTQATNVYQEAHDALSQTKSPEEAMAQLESDLEEQEQAY